MTRGATTGDETGPPPNTELQAVGAERDDRYCLLTGEAS